MRTKFSEAWRSIFVRNVALLASGTAVAQAFILLASPVLSRLFDPTAFGILAVVLAISGPLIEIGGFKYEYGIVLARTDGDAANLLILSALSVLFIGFCLAIGVSVSRDWLANMLDTPAAAPLLLFCPVFVVLASLYNVAASWANRHRNYKSIAASEIYRSASMTLVQIALGVAVGTAKGLIFGRLVGQSIGLVMLVRRIPREHWQVIAQSGALTAMRRVAREHRQFPLFSVPRELLVSLASNLTPFLLAVFFGAHSAGLYWFAFRLLEAPKTMISLAVRRVLYERAAALHQNGETLLPILSKTTLSLAVLAVLPSLVLILLGPGLFALVFGESWREAGIYVQWLTAWWLSSFVVTAATTVVPILHLQNVVLKIEAVGFLLRMAGLGLGILWQDDVLAIAFYSMAGFTANAVRMVFVFWRASSSNAGFTR
jgi:O-antigen/teichoic acid export membrane protein